MTLLIRFPSCLFKQRYSLVLRSRLLNPFYLDINCTFQISTCNPQVLLPSSTLPLTTSLSRLLSSIVISLSSLSSLLYYLLSHLPVALPLTPWMRT